MERIRLREHVAFQDGKMARHRLAATAQFRADLYCLRPGQGQAAHVHGNQDKLYMGIEGRARIRVGSRSTGSSPACSMVPAGVVHGLENPTETLCVALVVVVPPPLLA